MNFILTSLSLFYESQLLMTQFGFHFGKGCNNGIYFIKQREIAYFSKQQMTTSIKIFFYIAAYDYINKDFFSI